MILLGNLKILLNACFGILDYGVYHQALLELSSLKSFNPFLSARGINVFNDHFDPVIFLATPFYWITNNHTGTLMFFEWSVLLSCIFLIFKLTSHSSDKKLVLSLFLVFSKGVMSAYWFPAHPTTWSIFAIFILFYSIEKKNTFAILASVFFLCLFKESFAFALIFISIYFLIKKNYTTGLGIVLISLIFIVFELKFRKELFGATHDYSTSAINQLKNDPFNELLKSFQYFSLKGFLKLYYPFIPFFYFLIKKKLLQKSYFFFSPYTLFFTSLYGLHLLCRKLGFHYNIQFFAIVFSFFLFSRHTSEFLSNKKYKYITLLLFFLSGLGTYTKYFNVLIKDRYSKCEMSSDKRISIKHLKTEVEKLKGRGTIASSGGIINSVLIPGLQIYHFRGYGKQLNEYDYILLEKTKGQNLYPINHKIVDHILKKHKDLKVIFDDKYFFLAKGPIHSKNLY